MDQVLRKGDRNPAWAAHFPRRLQIVAFTLVCAVSLLGVFGIESSEMRRHRAGLERNASDIAVALRQLDAEHEIYLRAAAALLATHATITDAQFDRLQHQLNFNGGREGALGLGWAPRIPAGELPRAQIRLQAQTSAGFHIRRLAGDARRDAFPVVFLKPATGINAVALGFDMYSDPTRRAAMDQAAASASPVATGRVQLVQDGSAAPSPGLLVYMPVFEPGKNGGESLRGFVFMPLRAHDLLALAGERSIRDQYGRGRIRVAAYDGQVGPDRVMAWLGPDAGAGRGLTEQVSIANRRWLLVVSTVEHDGLSLLSQITIISGLIVALLLIVLIRMTYRQIDEERQMLDWQASSTGIRNSLTRELNHRVKNTLATVLSIVTLTRRRATDLDSYVESLSGRIRALSATHDLLTTSEWASIELRQIILTELAPYLGANEDHVRLDGPAIHLAPNDALTLGLAVHELATNAAKYGALSVLTGSIAIRWQQVGDDRVEINWQEMGGPEVCQPTKRGFGRELIEKILARELDSPVELRFAKDGLQCIFRVPLRQPGPFVLRAQRPANAA